MTNRNREKRSVLCWYCNSSCGCKACNGSGEILVTVLAENTAGELVDLNTLAVRGTEIGNGHYQHGRRSLTSDDL